MTKKKNVLAKPSKGTLIGYARVSTPDQNLNIQLEALRDYGVSNDNIFAEKASGAAKRRPRLDEAIAKADKGDTIVVWKLDRFGRSIVDLLARLKVLQDRDIGFVSLSDHIDTSTSSGRLMVHVLASIAQFERDLIADRTRAGIRHKMKTEGYIPGPERKLKGAPVKYAQKRREQGISVPRIKAELKEKYGISVSPKTIYNQTRGPERTREKPK